MDIEKVRSYDQLSRFPKIMVNRFLKKKSEYEFLLLRNTDIDEWTDWYALAKEIIKICNKWDNVDYVRYARDNQTQLLKAVLVVQSAIEKVPMEDEGSVKFGDGVLIIGDKSIDIWNLLQ